MLRFLKMTRDYLKSIPYRKLAEEYAEQIVMVNYYLGIPAERKDSSIENIISNCKINIKMIKQEFDDRGLIY